MDQRSVIRSAGTVGFFILVSRVFGLARDMAMAALFGSSAVMDAFVVAFTIPNLFRGLFGEGALSSAFVPVFTESLERQDRRAGWRFAAAMTTFLALTLAALVAAGILLATLALRFWPLSPRTAMILNLLRIMLPYMFLICLAALFSAMLNALRKFTLPAATPLAMNLVMLAVLLGICPRLSAGGNSRILAVAWSVLVSGVIQALMQWPLLLRCGFRPRPVFDWRDPRIRRVWQLMGAAALGVGVTQINVLLNRFVAVLIGQGAPSYLYYAERLIYLPLGIFATALGTILLPAFSGQAARDRPDLMRGTLHHGLRQILFLMLPAAAGLAVLARPIVRLIYERGDFSPLTTEMTVLAVRCYAPGLVVFSLLKVLIPVFYALQDMRTPVRTGMACTALNVVLMLALMGPLRHAGIALASVLSAACQAAILGLLVHQRLGSPGWTILAAAAGRLAAATAIMAAAAAWLFRTLAGAAWAGGLPGLAGRLLPLTFSLAAAVAVYGAAARLFRCPELDDVVAAFRRRRTAAPDAGPPPPARAS